MPPRAWFCKGARLLGLAIVGLLAAASARAEDGSAAPAPRSVPPAANLRVRVTALPEKTAAPLDPTAAVWEQATPTRLLLSRTPRLYQSENPEQPSPLAAEVRAVRAGSALVLRLRWSDATPDLPQAPPARTDASGESNPIYKRPTGATDTFADAAAVMVPESWTGPRFPSLVMGDQHAPALLYYWNAPRGAEIVKAAGRETTSRTGRPVPHRARHAGGHWTVTLALPALPAGYPVAFALWDGHVGDRDGIKFFSIWYVLADDSGTAGAEGE